MPLSNRLGALRHPAYFRYWSGSFASVGATQLQTMAQGWLLYQLTDSTIQLGYLGAAAAIPAILMTLFGGVLADRLNRKKLLMTTSLCVASLLALLTWLDYSALVQSWHIILIAGIVSFISGFDWPTRQAIFPTLIEKEDMMSAVALNSIIWQSCRMIMPAFGGVLIAAFSTWLVFLLCSLGFLIMFVVVAGLPIHVPASKALTSSLQQMKEGVSFILGNQVFLIFISLSYAGMFFGMAHMQLMPAFAERLSVGEQGYGLLISATGVGSVIGTILVGLFQQTRRLGWLVLGASAASATSVYLFTLATGDILPEPVSYPLAIFALALASMFSSMFMISSMTVLQLEVPDQLRGRVMGFHGITYSLMPLGGLFAGWVATFSSAPVAIAIGISIYLIIIAMIAIGRPAIRNISAVTAQVL